jgi:hypothetical protein
MTVPPVVAHDKVIRMNRTACADRNGLLSDTQVNGGSHFIVQVFGLNALLNHSDAKHIVKQIYFFLGIDQNASPTFASSQFDGRAFSLLVLEILDTMVRRSGYQALENSLSF